MQFNRQKSEDPTFVIGPLREQIYLNDVHIISEYFNRQRSEYPTFVIGPLRDCNVSLDHAENMLCDRGCHE